MISSNRHRDHRQRQRRITAAIRPAKITLAPDRGGTCAAAMPITTALSPASMTSIITTWASAIRPPGLNRVRCNHALRAPERSRSGANASPRTMAAAWATLRERIPGRMGIKSRASAAACTASGTPALSRPTSRVSRAQKRIRYREGPPWWSKAAAGPFAPGPGTSPRIHGGSSPAPSR